MWLDESNLFIPRSGPVTTFVVRQPEPVGREDEMVTDGAGHGGIVTQSPIKPRPLVAPALRTPYPTSGATNGRGFMNFHP